MALSGPRRAGAHVLVAAVVVLGLLIGVQSAPTRAAPGNGMIAFFARNNADHVSEPLDLMVMNADGSSPRVLVRGAVERGQCGFGLDWSPDGNRIAYASGDGVWVIGANGSGKRRITSYCGGSVSWSPNGDWLAVEQVDLGTFLIRPDGTGARYLRGAVHGTFYEFGPAFAANGNTVVESTVVLGDGNGWGVYGFDVGDGHVVNRYVSLDTVRPGSIARSVDVRVAGPAALIALDDIRHSSCDPLGGNSWLDSNLYTLAAPPDAPLVRIGKTTGQFQLRESDGAWSPDGQSVVFVGYRATKCNDRSEVTTPSGIYTMDVDGANVRRLYVAPGDVPLVVDPHWQACGPSTKACRVAIASCRGLAATIVGTSAGETLNGTSGDDVIAGQGGADTIKGLGGGDTVCGGLGNDTIDGGTGPDTLYGDDGDDTVLGGGGTDIVRGSAGNDAIGGGASPGDQCFGDNDTDTLVPTDGCESVSSVP